MSSANYIRPIPENQEIAAIRKAFWMQAYHAGRVGSLGLQSQFAAHPEWRSA